MQVQTAPNGWPGIFIPGDEALGLASLMRKLASAVEDGSVGTDVVAVFMRNEATKLEACSTKELRG